jgi:hypothetical protein
MPVCLFMRLKSAAIVLVAVLATTVAAEPRLAPFWAAEIRKSLDTVLNGR